METLFRKLGDHSRVDLVPYLTDVLSSSNDIQMLIGSDSHNSGKHTIYATVIVLHFGTNGAHVLYCKEYVPRVHDTFMRLWKEVERSMYVAEYLHDKGLPKADYIDLDFNPDPKYRSNSVLRSAVGYVESMGYVARTKPHSPAASTCADAICH